VCKNFKNSSGAKGLIPVYEKNCPLKPVSTGKHSWKWIYDLKCLRREVKQIFKKCQADKTPESWELYRQAQWRYIKEVRNASKDAWSTFCNSANNLPYCHRMTTQLQLINIIIIMSATLHRSLSKDSRI
jgi:hypothetical protein